MPRRQCPVTQAAIARAIRAAKQEGARAVRVDPDGTIWIDPNVGHGENPQVVKKEVAGDRKAEHDGNGENPDADQKMIAVYREAVF